ncbi:MAG: hypothetical protein IV090_22490 [Candidatus Sericytochromatia bacterium]|nr:hypothetical protein [Candidatus Sericytochromatia bacterium]
MPKLMSLSNPFILKQDQRVVLSQRPLNSLESEADHLIGADRAISKYRHWLRKKLEVASVETPLPLALDS